MTAQAYCPNCGKMPTWFDGKFYYCNPCGKKFVEQKEKEEELKKNLEEEKSEFGDANTCKDIELS